MRQSLLRYLPVGLAALAVAPATASAAPTITLNPPVVMGTAVSLSANLTSNGSCGASASNPLVGCYANYMISGGFSGANLWWNDFGGAQPIPQAFNLYGKPAGTYTVSLVAVDSRGTHYSSNTQQFEWPAGHLAVEDVALTGDRVAYRVTHGATPFASATATITLSERSGKRLGSFRRNAEPGLNVDAIPLQLRARLEDGGRYPVPIRVQDPYGRTATVRRGVVA